MVSKITDDIYIGGITTQEILKHYKFKSIINLSNVETEYSAEHLPLNDNAENSPEKLINVIKNIDNKIKAKKTPIYVGCKMGMSRSVVIVALYLYYTKKFKTFDEALVHVKKIHTSAEPVFELVEFVKEKVIPLLKHS